MFTNILITFGNMIPYLLVAMTMYTASSIVQITWASLSLTIWTAVACGGKFLLELVRFIMDLNNSVGTGWQLFGMMLARVVVFSLTFILSILINLGLLVQLNINRILGIILNVLVIALVVWFFPLTHFYS